MVTVMLMAAIAATDFSGLNGSLAQQVS